MENGTRPTSERDLIHETSVPVRIMMRGFPKEPLRPEVTLLDAGRNSVTEPWHLGPAVPFTEDDRMTGLGIRTATFFVSVNVTCGEQDSSAVGGIHDVLRSHAVPALWSFEFTSAISILPRLAKTNYEYGVIVSGSWASPNSARTAFVRELHNRLDLAATLHVRPIALTTLHGEPPAHFDLLVKSQIPLVNAAGTNPQRTGLLMPRLSRYGIWQTHPCLTVPGGSRWRLPWRTSRLIRQAVERSQTFHLAVDSRRLVENVSSGLASLDKVMSLADRYRDVGRMRFVSATELLHIHSPRRQQLASRSVLRAA